MPLAVSRPDPLDQRILDVLEISTDYYSQKHNAKVVYWFSDITRMDVLTLFRQRREVFGDSPVETLVLVLHTPGGDIDAAYMLVQILRAYAKTIKIVVPHWAKSAGTLVCLSADELIMSGIAELGPLDPQIYKPGDTERTSALDSYQALETIKNDALTLMDAVTGLLIQRTGMKITDILPHSTSFVSSLLQPLTAQIPPENLGWTRRTLDISAEYARRLLKYRNLPVEDIEETVEQLVFRYPAHSFVIDADEAVGLGLPAEKPSDDTEERILDYLLLVARSGSSFIGSYPDAPNDNNIGADGQESTLEDDEYENGQYPQEGQSRTGVDTSGSEDTDDSDDNNRREAGDDGEEPEDDPADSGEQANPIEAGNA